MADTVVAVVVTHRRVDTLADSLAAFNLDAPRHVARFVHKNRTAPKPAAALIVSRGEDRGAALFLVHAELPDIGSRADRDIERTPIGAEQQVAGPVIVITTSGQCDQRLGRGGGRGEGEASEARGEEEQVFHARKQSSRE